MGGVDARTHAPHSLRRHRRHRHERHRRAAGEPRLRGQRLGREAIGRRRTGCETLGVRVARRPRRRATSATPTSWSSRRRCSATNPEVVEARARGDPGDPARRDARRADAAAVRHRGRRLARQDDDDVDDRAGAGARRPRPDGGDRRPAERVRQQRAARAGRVHGGGSGRERPVVPEAVAVDRGGDQHRPRAPGELRQLRRRCSRRSSTSPTRCRSTARSSPAPTIDAGRARCCRA